MGRGGGCRRFAVARLQIGNGPRPTNATAIYKQVPANIAGIDGTTFFSSSQDGNGGTVDLKLTVLFVNGRYIVMETVGTPTVMTSALEATLKSVMKGISLKVAK